MSAPTDMTGGAEPVTRLPCGGLGPPSTGRTAGAGVFIETVSIEAVSIEPLGSERA